MALEVRVVSGSPEGSGWSWGSDNGGPRGFWEVSRGLEWSPWGQHGGPERGQDGSFGGQVRQVRLWVLGGFRLWVLRVLRMVVLNRGWSG